MTAGRIMAGRGMPGEAVPGPGSRARRKSLCVREGEPYGRREMRLPTEQKEEEDSYEA